MAKSIMIQGTMSNVGKSVITAGLCRIFAQDGYKVAPFKSQNMALNSFVTKNGLEMGRAQVMQAEAAGIEPEVIMNPILLKPTGDTKSQLVVMGEAQKNMDAKEYFAYKTELIPQVMDAYNQLNEEYDIVVIEGAGSPAEINLKSEDIVNMGMAKMAGAPVLLVGDIDRGGVFAQLVGTINLLDQEERDQVKGLIINKFRGDKSILDPGIEMLKNYTDIPVVGVAPYVHLNLDEEDSLTDRFSYKATEGMLDIVVIRTPRISNFTDFLPFEQIEGVSLRYVDRKEDFGNPDMVCLPGSKNTMSDLKWIRESGFEGLIHKAKEVGTIIFGICGGYQMLGETISDPHGVEEGGIMNGLGLIPMATEFSMKKTMTRSKGIAIKGEIPVYGYEIHMGTSKFHREVEPFLQLSGASDNIIGNTQKDGIAFNNIYGTYLHGIFDSAEMLKYILSILGERKGIDISQLEARDQKEIKEESYNQLADKLREYLDIDAIYRILGMEDKE